MTIEGGPALPIVISQDAPDGSLSALPVYGTVDLPPSDRAMQGGPALPVKVLLDSDLVQNGGQYRLEGRPQALPVFLAPAGTPVLGQRPVPVYPLNRNIWYRDRLRSLFGSSIVGYWPMNEASGGTALDYSGRGFHGAYTGVTLGQPGIGDGRTCPLYDGIGDFNNIYSAGFAGAFNPAEGSLLIWSKVFNVGVWTDGAFRRMWKISADGGNTIDVYKANTNNTLIFTRNAGGVVDSVSTTVAGGTTDWFLTTLTWSIVADQLKAYVNQDQVGLTQTTLGTWVGAIAANLCTIGANGAGASQVWNGYHAHGLVLNRAATAAEVAAAAVV